MTRVQDARRRPCYGNNCNEECENSYDIWQADDPVGKRDGGYENLNVNQPEDTGRMHFEKSASEYCDSSDVTLNKCNDIEKNCGQDRCVDGGLESRMYRTMNEKNDTSSREDAMSYGHQNSPSSNELDDSERLRGGCGGGSCGSRPKLTCGVVKVIETPCCCTKSNYNSLEYQYSRTSIIKTLLQEPRYSRVFSVSFCTSTEVII